MNEPEDFVKGWLLKANQDYQAFQILLESEFPLLDMAAFHGQQAVEKWLKALIYFHKNSEPPRIHDLRSLLTILSQHYPEFDNEDWIIRAEAFSQFAVEIRYLEPTQPLLITQPNATLLDENLQIFRAFAKEKLGEFWVE